MPGPTFWGGAKHALVALSDAERDAANRVLAKLKTSGGGLGSHLGNLTQHATVHGGSSVKTPGMAPTLVGAHGSDTFVGGARTNLALSPATVAHDTVVGGSVTPFTPPVSVADALGKHGGQGLSLSNETINVAGTTAENLKAGLPHEATSAHAVTLTDKTSITIAGLSHDDISKLKH
jgi:hypothetical protein